jgi:hypothetical protein
VTVDVEIGLLTRFIGHLQLAIAIYYGAVAISYTLQFTTACIESSQFAIS